MNYFCAYTSMLGAMRKLSDAECGRLFRALLTYSDGKEPDNLQGREELLFDVFSQQIDRDQEKYQQKCRKNSENAGKRSQANVNDGMRSQAVANGRMRWQANANDGSQEEEKEKEDINDDYDGARAGDQKSLTGQARGACGARDVSTRPQSVSAAAQGGGFASEADASAYRAGMAGIESAAIRAGLPFAGVDYDRGERWMAEYTADWVIQAIDRCTLRDKRSWGTVGGILKSWKAKGGIDDADKPGKDGGAVPGHGGGTRQQLDGVINV